MMITPVKIVINSDINELNISVISAMEGDEEDGGSPNVPH
jgi:hypothetical protein